jgi:hypothetical protein
VPGEYPGPGSSPKKRLGLIIGISAAVVLVLIGVVGAVVYTRLTADTPRRAVDAWFGALKAGDVDEVRARTCTQFRNDINAQDLEDEEVSSVVWDITGLNQQTDNTATATIHITFTDNGEQRSETLDYAVVKEDGEWKVCGPAED